MRPRRISGRLLVAQRYNHQRIEFIVDVGCTADMNGRVASANASCAI
jgi:hypothetical protein